MSAESVFIHYKTGYSLSDKSTQQQVKSAFNTFVAKNIRDKHQKYMHNLQIVGMEEHACYTGSPSEVDLTPYYVYICLGLALPYFLISELKIARYEVTMTKMLKV